MSKRGERRGYVALRTAAVLATSLVMASAMVFLAGGSIEVAEAASNGQSSSGLANAKLPPGICDSSMPAVTLSNGSGSTGTNPDQPGYYTVALLSTPLTLDVNHDGVNDTVAVFVCGSGGNLEWTSMWIFNSKRGGLSVLVGPIYPRAPGTGDWEPLIKSVSAHGSDLVVNEIYSNLEMLNAA